VAFAGFFVVNNNFVGVAFSTSPSSSATNQLAGVVGDDSFQTGADNRASGLISGTAWRCWLEPISERST
jgi:hypothetical protein